MEALVALKRREGMRERSDAGINYLISSQETALIKAPERYITGLRNILP